MWKLAHIEQFRIPGVGVGIDTRALIPRDEEEAMTLFYNIIVANIGLSNRKARICGAREVRLRPPRTDNDVTIAVRHRGEIIGALVLYACRVERDGDTIRAAAFPAPGLMPVGRMSSGETAAEVMAYVLENDLPLRNGKVLDIVQFDFPQHREQRWVDDPVADAMIAKVEGALHPVRRAGRVPRDVRRKGVPRDPPSDP